MHVTADLTISVSPYVNNFYIETNSLPIRLRDAEPDGRTAALKIGMFVRTCLRM